MADRPQQIFLSYQRDDAAFAEELRGWLLDRGLQPWMDVHDIRAGAYWPDAIDAALQGSDIVIGVLSPASVASRNVKNEWDWALGNNRQLILLLIEPCDVPHRYIALNHLDFTRNHDDGYSALAAAIERTPTADAPLDPSTSTGVPNAGDATRESRRTSHPGGGSRLRRALQKPRSTLEMVGRDDEQRQLRSMLDGAISGGGSLVLVGGEAGIGKTTLISWLRGQAEQRGALALTGACYDLTTTPPYGPWIEILRAYLPEGDLPPVPGQISDETAIESFASQGALFDAIGEFFAEIAEQRPLLLVLEDLHWADPASLDFLRFFSRFLAGLPVLVVATYRDDELTRGHLLFELMPRLSRETGARRIALHRLDGDDVRALISARFALPVGDLDRLANYLGRFTGGNPFFAGELIESLVEQELLEEAGDGWRLGQLDDLRVPPLVREVVEARLARLDPNVREALEVAAVIGQTVPLDLWSAVSGLSERRMIAALEQSASAMVLRDDVTEDDVAFSHALLRETLYEGIVSLRRRMVHRQIGEAMEALPGADPDEVAHHFRQAGDQRAIDWLLRAAERAERRYSWIMASERYDAALHILADDERRERDRGWLLMHLGRLLRFSRREATLLYLEEALRIATRIGDSRLEANALWMLGITHIIDGTPVQGLDEKQQALEMLEAEIADSPPQTEPASKRQMTTAEIYVMPWQIQDGALTVADVVVGWGTLAQFTASIGRFERAAEIRAKIERSKVADARSNALPGLALEHAFRGRPDEARSISNESLDYVRFLEHHILHIAGLTQYLLTIHMPYFTENVDERRRLLSLAYESAEAAVATVGYTTPGRGLHLVHYYDGRWDHAEQVAIQALDSGAPRMWHPLVSATLALLAHHRGNDEQAWEYVHTGVFEHIPPIPGRSQYLNTYCLVRAAAEIAVDTGDLEQTSVWIGALGDWLDYTDAILGRAEMQLLQARCHYLRGDVEQARRDANAALARATEPRQPLAQIAIHRFLGRLDLDARDLPAAENHLTQSRRLAEDCRLPFELALTLLELARLQVATGDLDDAQRLLAEVRNICEPLGAKPTLDRVAELEVEVDRADG